MSSFYVVLFQSGDYSNNKRREIHGVARFSGNHSSFSKNKIKYNTALNALRAGEEDSRVEERQ